MKLTFTIDLDRFDEDEVVYNVQDILHQAGLRLESLGVNHMPGELFALYADPKGSEGEPVGSVELVKSQSLTVFNSTFS